MILSIDASDTLIRKPRGQVLDAPAPRDDRVGAYLLEGEQHEGAFVHSRVGYLQPRLMKDQVAQQQEVKIQSTGPVALAAHAAVARFEREQLLQQLARGKRGIQHRYGVDEVGLVQLADWRSSVQ